MTSIPAEGAKAPAFSLPAHDGSTVGLAGLKGKPVLLYFYPKDNTPGCTVEAKGFGALAKAFFAAGAVVLGVSPDSVASHCKFAEKFDLNFLLLADTEHAAAEAYGVWVEKSMCGKTYMGIQRATFLIDPSGKIARVWPKVKPDGHAEEVLEAVKAL
jgi:peroxiredoxin Q/BCP